MRDEFLDTLGRVILEYANTFGSFTRRQAYFMHEQKAGETIDKAINRLMKTKRIQMDSQDKDAFTISNKLVFSRPMTRAMWPMLVHKGTLIPNQNGMEYWFMKGTDIAPVTYMLNGVIYDVVPLDDSKAASLVWINKTFEKEKSEGLSDSHVYILLMPDTSLFNLFDGLEFPHLFATVDEYSEELIPVTFYDANGEKLQIG